MLRTIVASLVLCLAAPLCAGGLVEQLFIQKIADDWYSHFKLYVETECKSERFPLFHHRDAAGALRQYRLQAVSEGKLTCQEVSPAPDSKPVKLEWSDWKPRYMAGYYPVTGNDDATDVVAFAIWLYLNAPDEPALGNRVLTVLYERDKALQDDIAEFVRDREQWKGKDSAAVGEAWDAEFLKWRRLLMPAREAERRDKDRKTEARETTARLLEEYANRPKRTLTLGQIADALCELKLKYAGTDSYDKRAAEVEKTQRAIEDDIKQIGVFTELAEKAAPDAVGAEYEKALELDPCSALLLSKAANAWCKHGNPEFLHNEWICTHESSIRKARDLYLRWLKREPENTDVLDQLIVCHEVLGETNDAQAMRDRKAKLPK